MENTKWKKMCQAEGKSFALVRTTVFGSVLAAKFQHKFNKMIHVEQERFKLGAREVGGLTMQMV